MERRENYVCAPERGERRGTRATVTSSFATGSDMTELLVTVALVPRLSPLFGGSGSFHQFHVFFVFFFLFLRNYQFHVNNIKLLLFNLMCISRVSRVILFC